MRVSIPRPSVAAAIQSTAATAATCANVLQQQRLRPGDDARGGRGHGKRVLSQLKAASSASERRTACRRCA